MNIQQVSLPISVEYQLLVENLQIRWVEYIMKISVSFLHKYSVLLIEGDSYALEENTQRRVTILM